MINRYGIALATSYHLITASHEFRMRGRITVLSSPVCIFVEPAALFYYDLCHQCHNLQLICHLQSQIH